MLSPEVPAEFLSMLSCETTVCILRYKSEFQPFPVGESNQPTSKVGFLTNIATISKYNVAALFIKVVEHCMYDKDLFYAWNPKAPPDTPCNAIWSGN